MDSSDRVFDYDFFNDALELRGGDLYWKNHSQRWRIGRPCARSAAPNGYRDLHFFTGYDEDGKETSKMFRQHRVIWLLVHKSWPTDEIDHINGNKIDNRPSNLRDVSRSDNQRNSKIRSNNTSGTMGVGKIRPQKGRPFWRVVIFDLKGIKKQKQFRYKKDAVSWRKSMEIKCGYHKNHGRG